MSKIVARIWDDGEYVTVPVCCEDMAFALSGGTDNEGYGAVARIRFEKIFVGSIETRINYCPWCGKKQEDRHE